MRSAALSLCIALSATLLFACRGKEEEPAPKGVEPAAQARSAAVEEAEQKLRALEAEQQALQEKLARLRDRAEMAAELEEELGILKRELDRSRIATAQAEEALRKARVSAAAPGETVGAGAAAPSADAEVPQPGTEPGGTPLPDVAGAGQPANPPLPIDSKPPEGGDAASAGGAQDAENVVLAPPVGQLALLEMKTAASVDREGRLPVQEQTTFAAGQSDVYVWLHLANAAPDETRVVVGWFKGDKEISNIELKVAGNMKRWRTWAHTRPPKHAAGEWRVEVRDLAGNVLGSRQFLVQ
ncbi:MAG: DUF2914 domain-containing protein [Deltaproteobacteria bacterium]|nr:DUF2914 domain-containing protein [Deltaproteobacteria bacterium]